MAITDNLSIPAPQAVFLFPTPSGVLSALAGLGEFLAFQYWPSSLSDDYQVEYAEHQIPGGSHPLYQWVGGRGRTISFQAVFTAEINETSTGAATGIPNNPTELTPSSRFTVNVSAALDKIRSWMRPAYGRGGRLGLTDPPKILTLVFPGTGLSGGGGTVIGDPISVILRSAPITYEAWFPNGEPRIATVDLQFSEIVQSPADDGASTKIRFRDRLPFLLSGTRYNFKSVTNRPLIGSTPL